MAAASGVVGMTTAMIGTSLASLPVVAAAAGLMGIAAAAAYVGSRSHSA